MPSKRPARGLAYDVTSFIPEGPLGFLGGGDAIGAAGYFTVATINGIVPIDGVEIGFNIESHNVDRSGDTEEHTFLVHSASEHIAEFVAKYNSAPTNINFLSDEIELKSIEEVESRRGFSLWKVVTEVETGPGERAEGTGLEWD